MEKNGMKLKILLALVIIIGVVLVLGYCSVILSSDLPAWAKLLLL